MGRLAGRQAMQQQPQAERLDQSQRDDTTMGALHEAHCNCGKWLLLAGGMDWLLCTCPNRTAEQGCH